MPDTLLQFHSSFNSLLATFRQVITSILWAKVSVKDAQKFYREYPYIVDLTCAASEGKAVKIDKSILQIIEKERFNKETPLTSQALVDIYRILTIAVKDIVWEDKDFESILATPEVKMLKHLRNASAHDGKFYWGDTKDHREHTLSELPLKWQDLKLTEDDEGTEAYFDFMKPGDLFILLSDISSLADS